MFFLVLSILHSVRSHARDSIPPRTETNVPLENCFGQRGFLWSRRRCHADFSKSINLFGFNYLLRFNLELFRKPSLNALNIKAEQMLVYTIYISIYFCFFPRKFQDGLFLLTAVDRYGVAGLIITSSFLFVFGFMILYGGVFQLSADIRFWTEPKTNIKLLRAIFAYCSSVLLLGLFVSLKLSILWNQYQCRFAHRFLDPIHWHKSLLVHEIGCSFSSYRPSHLYIYRLFCWLVFWLFPWQGRPSFVKIHSGCFCLAGQSTWLDSPSSWP